MPTFEDPKVDADELGEAARGLAYATRSFETPVDTYEVLGSLHHALSGVQQSLQQLAAWHEGHGQFAATDGWAGTRSQCIGLVDDRGSLHRTGDSSRDESSSRERVHRVAA